MSPHPSRSRWEPRCRPIRLPRSTILMPSSAFLGAYAARRTKMAASQFEQNKETQTQVFYMRSEDSFHANSHLCFYRSFNVFLGKTGCFTSTLPSSFRGLQIARFGRTSSIISKKWRGRMQPRVVASAKCFGTWSSINLHCLCLGMLGSKKRVGV